MIMSGEPAVALKVLEAANFDLQEKLEKSLEQFKSVKKENGELVDRLEKALLIAAKLKNAENDNIQLREKYATAEQQLRSLYMQNSQLENSNADKAKLLTQVREKYFTERTKNQELVQEIERVKSVSDLAKREIDHQINKVSLREIQLNTMRTLVNSGEFTHQVAAATSIRDELDFAVPSVVPFQHESAVGIEKTTWQDWQRTKLVTNASSQSSRVSENLRKILISGGQSGTLFEDQFIKVTVSIKIEHAHSNSVAIMHFMCMNVSPAIIQGVRILDATRRGTSEFLIDTVDAIFLKPGQHVSVNAQFTLTNVFETPPTICVSYTPSGDLPKNQYMSVPLALVKFCFPSGALSNTQVIEHWTRQEFTESEICCKFNLGREDLRSSSLASIVSICEFGGSFVLQRGIDPNPRGQILSSSLVLKKSPPQNIFMRVELSPTDRGGPTQCRLTVRSPQAVISKAVVSNLLDVLI